MAAYTTIQPGNQVKVMSIPDWLLRDLSSDEQNRIAAQKGCIVTVLKLQPHGYLWLTFADGTEGFTLQPSDVQLVGGAAA